MRDEDLAAVARAREELRGIDLDAAENRRRNRLTRAIEAFDEIVMEASLDELAALGQALAKDEKVVDLAEECGCAEAE